MTIKQFNLPDPGEGLTEAEIVTWRVKVGDTVKINDIVVEIETAKSLVELPVPFAGTVTELFAEEGATVEVGTPIISIQTVPTGSAGVPPVADEPAAQRAVEPGMVGSPAPKMEEEAIEEGKIGGTTSTGRTAVLVGYGVKQTEAVRRPRRSFIGSPDKPAPDPTTVLEPSAGKSGQAGDRAGSAVETVLAPKALSTPDLNAARALAKPPVRKLAKDLGVDLASVAGSGPGGIVTRADVEAHAEDGVAQGGSTAGAERNASRASRSSGAREVRVPIKGVRKMTAQAMVSSAFTAPHVTEFITLDATGTMELVERLKKDREFRDVKVTPLLVLAKALCVAIRRHPQINASWDEAAQEIVVKHYVNLGIAAATPRGLIVPNVKDAQDLSMLELAEEVGALTATAREGRTQPADMTGGTITITNVGVFGVDTGTPILNPGESAIVAFGAIRRQPWVVTGADGAERIEPRWVTQLALSFDHRLVDGELGSRFLADVAALLADPARGLVWG